jgi:SAM-dependent methyltransferase
MLPKPKHLGPEYAAVFQDQSVVEAYHHRPPYPREAIAFLAGLAVDSPRAVLDVGCGAGDVARPLAPFVDRIDAIDISDGMIERGKLLPGGGHPAINWIHGSVEEAALASQYALITAGESLHWMAWDVVLPRFAGLLTTHGMVAIVDRNWEGPPPLWEQLLPLIQRYTTNRDFQPYDLIAELEVRDLFHKRGEYRTEPVVWQPSIEEYIECRHSQNGLSRDRMGDDAAAFDAALREILESLVRAGAIEQDGKRLRLAVTSGIVWGVPALSARAHHR